MSGVYGNMLLMFPEQMRTVSVYKMDAQVNGGFKKVSGSEKSIRCTLQHTRGRLLKDSNGNLVRSSGFELWTNEKSLVGFFAHIGDEIYRISGSFDWTFEGGFIKYTLEKVVGENGFNTEDITWNTGSHSFG